MGLCVHGYSNSVGSVLHFLDPPVVEAVAEFLNPLYMAFENDSSVTFTVGLQEALDTSITVLFSTSDSSAEGFT